MSTVSVRRLQGGLFVHETIIQGLFGIHGILLGKHPTCRPVFKSLTLYYVLVVVNTSVVVKTRNYSANTPVSDFRGTGSVTL